MSKSGSSNDMMIGPFGGFSGFGGLGAGLGALGPFIGGQMANSLAMQEFDMTMTMIDRINGRNGSRLYGGQVVDDHQRERDQADARARAEANEKLEKLGDKVDQLTDAVSNLVGVVQANSASHSALIHGGFGGPSPSPFAAAPTASAFSFGAPAAKVDPKEYNMMAAYLEQFSLAVLRQMKQILNLHISGQNFDHIVNALPANAAAFFSASHKSTFPKVFALLQQFFHINSIN